MFKPNQNRHSLISVTQITNIYQHHPSMLGVERLKDKLKQEKLQDKVFYQEIKHKIATR